MKFENKDFWNQTDVILSQDKSERPRLSFYEQILLQKLPLKQKSHLIIQVLGCGTGREIPGILENFPNAKIVASDIAEKMIEKCFVNIDAWQLKNDQVKVLLSASENLDQPSSSSDIITTFTSTLTYVVPEATRHRFFSNANRMLKHNGYIVGVVHHRYGRLSKSLYFLLQSLYAWLPGVTNGDRIGGFFGKGVKTHYFTCKEVKKLLLTNGFNPILVTDLKGLYASLGKNYNSLKGDNNIVFIGQKK